MAEKEHENLFNEDEENDLPKPEDETPLESESPDFLEKAKRRVKEGRGSKEEKKTVLEEARRKNKEAEKSAALLEARQKMVKNLKDLIAKEEAMDEKDFEKINILKAELEKIYHKEKSEEAQNPKENQAN